MTEAETPSASLEDRSSLGATDSGVTVALGPARWLLWVAIVLIPFNDLPYLESVLREASHEAALYAALPAMALWLCVALKSGTFEWPRNPSFIVLTVLLGWIALATLINMPAIVASSFKGRSGLAKLGGQVLMLSVAFGAAVFVYNLGRTTDDFLEHVRRFAVASVVVVGAYAAIEIAYLHEVPGAANLLEALNPLFHRLRDDTAEFGYLYPGRLRGVSGEASWFAMYAGFAFPWVVSAALEPGRRRWLAVLLTAYLLYMLLLTESRTAYGITLVQAGLLTIGRRRAASKRRWLKRVALGVAALGALAAVALTMGSESRNPTKVATSLAAGEDSTYFMSNLTRTAVQFGTLLMAIDHPVAGVGYGQSGFHIAKYMPEWASISPETAELLSPNEGTPWPPSHGLYVRMAAEAGIVGALLFIAVFAVLLWRLVVRLRQEQRAFGAASPLGRALLAAMGSVTLAGLNTDSVRFFSVPVTLGCAWWYLSRPSPEAAPESRDAAPATAPGEVPVPAADAVTAEPDPA